MVRVCLVSNISENRFEIDEKIARQSSAMRGLIDNRIIDDTEILAIRLNIHGLILEKIIQWADYRKNEPESSVVEKNLRDLCRWDILFFHENRGILQDIIKAAKFCKFEQLYSDASVFVSDIMKRKTSEEVQEYFELAYAKKKAATISDGF